MLPFLRARSAHVLVVVAHEDVSECKRLEDSLRQRNHELAEADRRKTEFLGMLAHELRNPMAPLLNGLHVAGQPGVSTSTMRQALETVVTGRSLDVATARAVMDTMMEGEASAAQVGALVAALRTKGETVDELSGMVESMRAHATQVVLPAEAVDTCGTGGDRAGTFNISTAAALVAAGAGCRSTAIARRPRGAAAPTSSRHLAS